MKRILIVDDHPIVVSGIRKLLEESIDIEVIDEAEDGEEALLKIRENDYDIVLLDIWLPGLNGLEVLKQIKLIDKKIPVLVFSMYPEEHYAVMTLKNGASGYVAKESLTDELVLAIKKIAQGKKYVSPSLAECLAGALDKGQKNTLFDSLSERECQVMLMIANGKSMKDIAGELSLSVKTISTYRARILEKLKLKSNAEIVKFALQNRIVY